MTAALATSADDDTTKHNNIEEKVAVPPPTQALYMTYEGNWLTECDSKVVSVREDGGDGKVQVCLDQTVMHAQGGGQPTDVGTILASESGSRIRVTKVTVDRETGVVLHAGEKVGESSGGIEIGETVKVKVDQGVRKILSECHTAGHCVDSAMAACGKLLKPTKGYHFLDGPYVEYEGAVPPEERKELLQQLQSSFCHLVEQDIATEIDLMSKEEADAVCNRQAQNFDLDVFADRRTNLVRVVTVAGFACPCGGTHARSTADLKERQWGITGLKCKKNVVRVKYGQQNKEE